MAKTEQKMYNERRFHAFREIIDYCAETYGKAPAFHIKNSDGSFRYISYLELKERFYALCNVFLDLGLGEKRIAVTGSNCFEWVLYYLCAATVGVAVPIDKELDPEDIRLRRRSENERDPVHRGHALALPLLLRRPRPLR